MTARHQFGTNFRQIPNLGEMGSNFTQIGTPTSGRLGPSNNRGQQEVYDMPGLPQFGTMSQTVSQRMRGMFSNNLSGSTVPNLYRMKQGLSMQNQQDGTNVPATATVIPRPFHGTHGEKDLKKGDVLFVSSNDKIDINHSIIPQRTVRNLQQLNSSLFTLKGKATKFIFDEMRRNVPNSLKIIGQEISLDLDYVVTEMRYKKNMLFENFEFYKDKSEAEAIMKEQYKKITTAIDDVTHNRQSDNMIVNFLNEFGQNLHDNFESHKYSYLMDLNGLFLDKLIYHCPPLILQRWKFIGVMMDRTADPRTRFQSFSKQQTVTYSLRGPTWTTNIFGDVDQPKIRTRMPRVKTNVPMLDETSKIFLALVMDNKQHKYEGVGFVPIWIRPFCSITRCELDNKLDQNYPLVENTYSYKRVGTELRIKKEQIQVNNEVRLKPIVRKYKFCRSEVPPIVLGTIIGFQCVKKKEHGFFKYAAGIKDYGTDRRIADVLKLRDGCGKLKIHVRT